MTIVPAFRIFELGALLARDALVAETLQTLPTKTVTGKAGLGLYLRIAIGTRVDANGLRDAAKCRDDEAVGQMLGYPECCIAFFRQSWIERGETDTTFAAATASAHESGVKGEVLMHAPPQANLLLRWLGVRLVPHLVCAFDCASSLEHGRAFAALGSAAGFADEVRWADEMLSWPTEWSALHGIAEIRTPVMKFITATDASEQKRVVRIAGATYPAEGARGVVFPYTLGTAVRNNAEGELISSDNGFATAAAMHAAHAPLVDLAPRVLSGPANAVLDLGCGNGLLLEKIYQQSRVATFGIDLDAGKCARAKRIHPSGTFTLGDLFGETSIWDRTYRLVLMSAARFDEAVGARRELLKSRINSAAEYLLIYAYPGTTLDCDLDCGENQVVERCGTAVLWRIASSTQAE